MPKFIDRTGETRIMNNGLSATIIAYRGSHDIDVLFENGLVSYNRAYSKFIGGGIMNPAIINRNGETKRMNNGLMATIIAYRQHRDIDVKFDNGVVARHRDYNSFKMGKISCPLELEYIDNYVKVTNHNVTPQFTFLIDADDVGMLGNGFWSNNGFGYVCSKRNGKIQVLHGLILQTSDNMQVDHINGDKSDCRRVNLRECLPAENLRNKSKQSNNTSGWKGVCLDKRSQKWRAEITVNGKRIHLGHFSDIEQAALTYNEAAIRYHGEFARLNDISA